MALMLAPYRDDPGGRVASSSTPPRLETAVSRTRGVATRHVTEALPPRRAVAEDWPRHHRVVAGTRKKRPSRLPTVDASTATGGRRDR